jgi:hypothetical protein
MVVRNRNAVEKRFYLHYDLNNWLHSIPVSQSIAAQDSIRVIVDEFSKKLFWWSIKVDVYIEGYDEWGVIMKYIFKIWVPIWTVIWILVPDVINWLVMWVAWWRNVEELVANWTESALYWNEVEPSSEESLDIHSEVFALSVEWFLNQQNLATSSQIWLDYGTYFKSYQAKNTIFTDARNNVEVRWIWFDTSHNFPVRREEFAWRIKDLSRIITWLSPNQKIHKLRIVSNIHTRRDKALEWHVR